MHPEYDTVTLRIATDLELPDDIAAQKNAILAMSGAGKSNTAVVLAEEMHRAGIPWVAIDPKGDWYGVRASADAKKPGLAIPVLGGLHGDVPLEPTGGKLVGNLIADSRLTCVLDVSEFDSRQDQYRFLADLGETLLKANRDPLHLFLEEADEYLPQTTREKGALPRCLGAWQRVVKRGRFRGLGTTLISQRSAALNKDVLNQTDTLIAMRVTAPRDRKAVEEWVSAWADREQLADFVASLPLLEDGEAWVWSPQRLKIVQRAHVCRRSTFDSGATPLFGAAAAKVATLVDVDLDALKDQMAATIERARAEDPAVLQARIRDLERELSACSVMQEVQVETVVETITMVPEGLTEAAEELRRDVAMELGGILDQYDELIVHLKTVLEVLGEDLDRIDALTSAHQTVPAGPAQAPLPPASLPSTSPPARASQQISRNPRATAPDSDVKLGKAERALLSALVQFGPRSRTVLAFLSGYSHKSSSYSNALGALRSAGLITPPGDTPIAATDDGLLYMGGDVYPLPSGPALYAYWTQRLAKAERAILQPFVDAYPASVERERLAELSGYSPTSSSFSNALGRLRSLELVNGWRASDELMEAIR